MANYVKVIIAIILNFLFWCGVYENLVHKQPNKCEMTYMYEYPQFVEIKMKNASSNYRLFAYGEGEYSRDLGEGKFHGIPVLFIPGNQGSYKQVRSLASVALRKAQNSYPFHFNYFTLDFHEDIGAFFGPVLEQQTRFVRLAVKAVLNLYKNSKMKPKSVVLVGHSIGGLVARAVVTQPEEIPPDLVSLIVTIATPHHRPVIIPDASLFSFYETVNDYWLREKNIALHDVPFVTVGGGSNDIQVPSSFTSSQFADVDATLLSVPSCWLTTDHLAIAWCKQLVLAITRALFQSVDVSTLQMTSKASDIRKAFLYHLSERVDENRTFSAVKQSVFAKMKNSEDWLEVKELQRTERFNKLVRPKLFAIPLTYDKQRQYVTILLEGPISKSWILAGQVDIQKENMTISSEENLFGYARLIPGNRKEVNVDLLTMQGRGFSHLLVVLEASKEQSSLEMEVSDGESHLASLSTPPFLSSFTPLPIMEVTPANALTLNITLGEFDSVWQSFVLSFTPVGECEEGTKDPVVSIKSSKMDRWEAVVSDKENANDFRLSIDVPLFLDDEPGSVEVHVIKSPSCDYAVSLRKSLPGIFERVALLYVPQAPVFVVCHVLLSFSNQYKDMSRGQTFFATKFLHTPISVVPFAKLMAYGLSKISDPESYGSYLEKIRSQISVMPIVLFTSSLALTFALASVWRLALVSVAKAVQLCVPRATKKKEIYQGSLPAAASRLFNTWTMFAVALLSVGASTCGTLALLAAAAVYFWKLIQMQVRLLRSESKSRSSKSKDPPAEGEPDFVYFSIDFHLTAFLLVLLVSTANLPSLVAWVKKFPAQRQLTPDPSFFPCGIILLALAILWQLNDIKPKNFSKYVGYIIHFGAILSVLYGSVYHYMISEIASITLLIVALHQLIFPE